MATGGARRNPWVWGFSGNLRPAGAAAGSIEQVPLVVLDPVRIQEFPKLLRESALSMMHGLVADILLHSVKLGRADGERGVAFLPVERPHRRKLAMNPG